MKPLFKLFEIRTKDDVTDSHQDQAHQLRLKLFDQLHLLSRKI